MTIKIFKEELSQKFYINLDKRYATNSKEICIDFDAIFCWYSDGCTEDIFEKRERESTT